MKIWITKPWPPGQIILLKWCCLAFGVALGAWFGAVLRPYAPWILIAAILLAVGPTMHYFSDKH
jgi:hypothetical protein